MYCKKDTNHGENYQKHVQVRKGSKYGCEYCNKAFSTQSSLKYDMLENTGEYKFVCDKCNKGFNLKLSFEKHTERHEKQVADNS